MKVRAWYGLPGDIEVENELWHLVRVAGMSLPHPPLVNLVLRRGLPRADRLRLSYLHEFGHFQTLPLALAHGLGLLWITRKTRRSLLGWLAWSAGAVAANEAVWELLSEGYVVARDPAGYRKAYRQTHGPVVAAFWAIMGALGIGVSWALTWQHHTSVAAPAGPYARPSPNTWAAR